MKVKRFLCLLLSTVTLMGVLAACGEQEAPVETTEPPAEGTKLWYAYNTESLMRDLAYEEAMNSRDYTLRMMGVRGEQESAQLMITPDEYVEEYNLKTADLVNENGDKIKKSNIFFISILQSVAYWRPHKSIKKFCVRFAKFKGVTESIY